MSNPRKKTLSAAGKALRGGRMVVVEFFGHVEYSDAGQRFVAVCDDIKVDGKMEKPSNGDAVVSLGNQLLDAQMRVDIVTEAKKLIEETLAAESTTKEAALAQIKTLRGAWKVFKMEVTKQKKMPADMTSVPLQLSAMSESMWLAMKSAAPAIASLRGTYYDDLKKSFFESMSLSSPAAVIGTSNYPADENRDDEFRADENGD